MRNKKANFSDVVSWIEVCLVLVFVGGITLVVVDKFDDQVQAQNVSVFPQQVKDTSKGYRDWLPTGLDYLFVFMYPIFLGFSVMAARLIPSTPKFILITVFAIILLPFGAMFAENILDGWIQQPTVSDALEGMIFLPFIIEYLRYFVLFYSVAVGVALLSKESG